MCWRSAERQDSANYLLVIKQIEKWVLMKAESEWIYHYELFLLVR